MAAISKNIFLNENVCILVQIKLKLLPKGPTDNKSSLVQVTAWHQTGNKSLPEPMVTQSTDIFQS